MTKTVRIQVDQEKARAARHQLGADVASALSGALSGRTVTQFRDDIYLIDVQARARRAIAASVAAARSIRSDRLRATRCRSPRSRRSNTASRNRSWRRNRLPLITVQSKIGDG